MNISEPFIRRPVATSLLAIAIAVSGGLAFNLLPVAPLPQVDFPTISVFAGLPGGSPETMASSVATPLERQFGRIAGVTEMTSVSYLGSTSITLQFDLNRNIDAAARDVQAAINAARGYLPANLPSNPQYRKVNPADAPVLILALTSDTVQKRKMFDLASTILSQKLSQVKGVGQVIVGGGALPAVRVELNPTVLNKYRIGLDEVRAALASANANTPKGQLAGQDNAWLLSTTDQLLQAGPYRSLIVAYRNGAAVRLSDVAEVLDSVEDVRTAGLANNKPAVVMIIFRQPGANIIDTVDRVRETIPLLRASLPPSVAFDLIVDRTTTIRASVHDVEISMLISISLVIMVVFVFLRSVWATMIPSISVPLSLVGTFGVMYLLGYSLDNLSLMALTISTGFVVDDAIVVIENITRYLETGMQPFQAALRGAKEIGFTVVSMSTSLIAVFIPILLMGGVVGRLFREFAVTLAVAISVSLVVSLTVTPMMCARFLKAHQEGEKHGFLYNISQKGFDAMWRWYADGLAWVLRHQFVTLMITLTTVGVNIYLYVIVPKGFFPQQDTGRFGSSIMASQDISFQAMQQKLQQFMKILKDDPAVDSLVGFTGSQAGTTNMGRAFGSLKPKKERKLSIDQVFARLRPKLAQVPGATLFLQAAQDIFVGGRMANGQYQFTLSGDNLKELNEFAPKMLAALRRLPMLVDVSSDQQTRGLEASLVIDRDTASRLGITPLMIDDALYDCFGQRQVSTMFTQLNQYHVVMEVAPQYWQNPSTLQDVYVRSTNGNEVPLSAFTHYAPGRTALSVPHQGQFPAITLSFNLPVGVALGDAVDAIENVKREIMMPASIRATFAGTAQAFQSSLANEPYLILAALVTVYLVLGMLYESYIHPITILSTLPSAGVGAIVALLLFNTELSIIALIGIILLIGIVKKNAIMMVDFALDVRRREGKSPEEAIYQACLLRFRPIMMTTMAALFGGMPLAIGMGTGSELRQPLGITIVGGLIFSQMLTLFTTPVIYLYLDRFSLWLARLRGRPIHRVAPQGAAGD